MLVGMGGRASSALGGRFSETRQFARIRSGTLLWYCTASVCRLWPGCMATMIHPVGRGQDVGGMKVCVGEGTAVLVGISALKVDVGVDVTSSSVLVGTGASGM